MTETTSSTIRGGGFTDAVRAVLVEMDIDNLPAPIGIAPHGAAGVRVQVADRDFAAWLTVLSNIHVTTPVRGHESSLGKTDHIHADGMINDHHVLLVTVAPAGSNVGAVAS